MADGNRNADDVLRAHIETASVHAGERGEPPDWTPTVAPIYATSSFSYPSSATQEAVFADERPGFVYSRYGNPTVRALEMAIADLEGTADALAVGSGMAALHLAILREVQAGDRLLASRDLYGATSALLVNVFGTLGITTSFVDTCDLDAVRQAINDVKPRALIVETISNPLMRVADLPAIAEIAKATRVKVIVDNTFASPALVNPARHGADTVVHSTTKYLAGHGDVTGGAIAADAGRIYDMVELNKLTGAVLGPFEAWLTLRGIKTLPLRVAQQNRTAKRVAEWLAEHPCVERVHYPGLADLGGAEAIFNGPERGAMMSFEIRGASQPEVHRFLDALQLCVPATTLGDVYTLVLYPIMSSHRGLTPEQRAQLGIRDNLVRLSVGVEHPDDIIADLDQALWAVARPR